MFAAWLVFGEHIGVAQLLGSAVIVGGILMLGADQSDPAPPSPRSTAHPGSGYP